LQRFDSGCRLVSILGPAGTGKTRLVCRYGHAWLGDWPGGVYFCDLSATRTLDGVLFAVASALEVPLGESDPVGQLGHALAARGRCLVILDNFEQIVDCALATVGRWLDQATDAAFAVTSRERLHIRGEEAYAVEPLPLGGDAIELFVARARARRPDFALTDDNHAAVAEVVRLVDGLPLAIELAAARINVLSPAQLVARMRDRFHLLAGARGSAERQATLKAAIDWSWNLLTAGEQQAFAQCSVFEGGFTMEAAEAVLDLGPSPEAPLLTDAIQSLVDKSLLRSWLPAQRQRYDIDEPYFGMYLSIQEYAAGKLRAQGPVAVDATEQRHGAHFARLGTVEALETLSCHGGVARRHALALELDNLIAACRRAAARGDAAVAVPNFRAAWEVLELRGPFTVGSSLAQQVLAIDPMDPALRAAAIWTQARILFRTGRLPESEKWLEQGLALAREAKDRRAEGVIRSALGVAIGSVGRIDEGLAHYEAALAIHREMGNPQYEAKALQNLSTLRAEQGRLAESLALGRHALAIYRETGHRVAEAQVLGNLAVILNDQGDGEDARRHFDAALAIEREIGNRWGEGNTLGNLAHLEMNAGRLDDARSHSERAVAIARDTGDRWALGAHLGHLAEIGAKQGSFDEAAALWNESLAIHRDVGNRRAEGATLVGIAELLASQGRNDEAEPLLNTADSLLREVGDKLLLAVLACVRGRNDVVRGRHEQAKCALAEAEALRDETGATLESPVGKEIARLRAALAASAA
jgi:predicted ATPase